MHNTNACSRERGGLSVDAGSWLTLVSIVLGLTVTVVGGIIRWQSTQNAELRREKETQRVAYEAKLELAERAVEAKSETIDDLRRQVDRLTITAEITDKLLKQLPAPPPKSGER